MREEVFISVESLHQTLGLAGDPPEATGAGVAAERTIIATHRRTGIPDEAMRSIMAGPSITLGCPKTPVEMEVMVLPITNLLKGSHLSLTVSFI